jgi:hypothetical protein
VIGGNVKPVTVFLQLFCKTAGRIRGEEDRMQGFRSTVVGAVVAIAVCMGFAAVHIWQAHGSGVAVARSPINSLAIAD